MSLEEEKRRDAEKCVEIAEVALSKRNFDKAERLLNKAERLYPMELTKQLLRDVQNERERVLLNNNEVSSENEARGAECVKIAKKAMADGDFSKAKRFLEKSLRMHSSDEAKKLLKELDHLKENYSPTTYSSNGSDTKLCLDDAEKCIQTAEKAFSELRLGKAERLVEKAERLHPTFRAKDLMRQIKDARERGVKDVDEGNPRKINEETPRKKLQAQRHKQVIKEKEETKKLEEMAVEQAEAIRRVKTSKNDFEILGIPSNSATKDVKKAYRKLTLLLHPDKNRAPEAKEAFMIVTEAVERLTKKKKNGLQC